MNPGTAILRYLRRTRVGGPIEYLAQFLDGLIDPKLLRSGETDDEKRRPLPGDDLVRHPMWEATRAVTIEAPTSKVWPWVAQMGYGRGGWYGWNPLEREDTGVDRLLSLPAPRVGDVWLDGAACNEGRGAWAVKAVEPPRTLVLYTRRNPVTGRELSPRAKHRPVIDTEWAFVLQPIGLRRARLLARTRIVIAPRWALRALRWMGGGDTVMQRRLLDGIKARAEAAGSRRSGPREASSAMAGSRPRDQELARAVRPGEGRSHAPDR